MVYGWKIKSIASQLGISKNTVKSYLQKIHSSKWLISDLLELEDPILETKFHAGNPAYKDQRYEQLKDQLEYYASELNKTGVTKLLLYEEYHQAFPDGYGRSQFCFHLLQYVRNSKPTMVLTHKPAEKLFIDFSGKRLSYIDWQSGEVILLISSMLLIVA